jgi:hypothetical protein
VRFVWSVERRPQIALTGLGSGLHPALIVRLRSGEYEPGLSQIMIKLPGDLTLPGGAKNVQVLDSSGRDLPHLARFQHQLLTINLDAAHSPLRIVFAAGSLHQRGNGSSILQVNTLDRVGGLMSFERPVRAAKTS